MKPAGDVLYSRLAAAVNDAGTVPCTGRDEWISEDRVERAVAAAECRACPVFALCHAYAETARPTAGVWAGKDRQKEPGRPGRKRRAKVPAGHRGDGT